MEKCQQRNIKGVFFRGWVPEKTHRRGVFLEKLIDFREKSYKK